MGAANVRERVMGHVDVRGPDECWPWQGCQTHDGYGLVYVNGSRIAHRVVYKLLVGPISDDLYVLHDCDNRLCCNPAHLHPGTQTQNMAEMVERGRAVAGRGAEINRNKTHCKHGHEFTPENTYVWVNKRGWRHRTCRACNRAAAARRAARLAGAR